MSDQCVVYRGIETRIKEALNRPQDLIPKCSVPRLAYQIENAYIGSVPRPLQHLHNLMAELYDELMDVWNIYEEAVAQFKEAEENFFCAHCAQSDSTLDQMDYYGMQMDYTRADMLAYYHAHVEVRDSMFTVRDKLRTSLTQHLYPKAYTKNIICCNWMITSDTLNRNYITTRRERFLTTLDIQ